MRFRLRTASAAVGLRTPACPALQRPAPAEGGRVKVWPGGARSVPGRFACSAPIWTQGVVR
jgi:hypothetical protein